jgi:hypothetical protein
MADLISCPDSANPPVSGSRNPTLMSLDWAVAKDGSAAVAAVAPIVAMAERRDGFCATGSLRFMMRGSSLGKMNVFALDCLLFSLRLSIKLGKTIVNFVQKSAFLG